MSFTYSFPYSLGLIANPYSATEALAAIRRRGLIPSSGRFSDTDLIAFMNDALTTFIEPLLLSTREQYLLWQEDTAISGTEYRLPTRATGEAVHQVKLVDADGNEHPLSYVEPTREHLELEGFLLRDNVLVLVGDNVTSGFTTLRLSYFRKPNRIVPLAQCARVLNKSATQVSLDAAPATFTTSHALDFLCGTPGFRWLTIDKTPTLVAGNTLTFAAGVIPSTLAVGDYLALAGESPIPQCPENFHPLLHHATACLVLRALGDQRLPAMVEELEKMEKKLIPTITPRTKGAGRVINPQGGVSTFKWWG